MRPNVLPLALALSIISMNTAAADTQITLYSGDFDAVSQTHPSANMPGLAQISQSLSYELNRGSNTVVLERLPLALDVGSVQLTPVTAGLKITSQRYDFALIGQQQLLQQAVGQRVEVEQSAGSETRRFSGILLAASDGLTLQQDDGRVRVLANYASFELASLPQGLTTRPTLRWAIESPRNGKQNMQLDYASGGMAWQAEYVIQLDGPAQTGRMAITGAAQVVNRSGLDFPGTMLTLVAGSPNQARSAAPRSAAMAAPMAKMAMSDSSYGSGIEAQDSGEYHAYPLPKPVDLPNGSVQRISLLDAVQSARYQRRYELGNVLAGYRPSRPNVQAFVDEQTLPVNVVLTFQNEKLSGLGMPLPNGRVRVFQAGASGDDLLGEAYLAHTASGQEIKLALGEVFDLRGKRNSTALQLADDRLSLTETVEFTLTNAKSQAATLHLNEALTRWQDWEIVESSHEWKPVNAQTIGFEVTVPAGKEITVSYRVRYRWPTNVRP